MSSYAALDCIVIGYNDPPFDTYESLIRNYGDHSEAYRDLKLNFVNLFGRRLPYLDLLNAVLCQMQPQEPSALSPFPLRSGAIPNLAAAYLTAYLQRQDLHAAFINLFQDEKALFEEYLRCDPSCVAITTTFYVINFPLYEMVQFIRRHNPKTKIVVGGPLISNHLRNFDEEAFRSALMDIGADIYVTDSQGEQCLANIVKCLKTKGALADIPNIAYFEAEKLHRTPNIAESNSLDANYIDWRTFRPKNLGPTVQTRTARSCAFNCAFCNYPTRAGKLSLASLATIEKELDSMKELGDVENVVFIDDTFNVPLPRFKDICRLMIRKEYGFNWFSYFRCSNSDPEAIELMARSGCKGVFLGIESASPRILQYMNKAATVEKYSQGLKLLRSHGILTFASFIVGFPGETESSVQETIDFIETNKPTYYRAQLWYCEHGTPIQRERSRFEIVGDGFVWSHSSMNSLQAADYIDRMMLSIDSSIWLPQWSFDFWVLPYLAGVGISLSEIADFVKHANRLLRLEVADISAEEKDRLRGEWSSDLIHAATNWKLFGGAIPGNEEMARPKPTVDDTLSAADAPTPCCKREGSRAMPDGLAARLVSLLKSYSLINDCVVVTKETASGTGLIAHYASRSALPVDDMRSFVAERDPSLECPSDFIHWHRLPLTLDGSLNVAVLAARATSQPNGRPHMGPRTPTEEIISNIWRQVLKRERIDINDTFESLGGDTMKAIRLLADVRDAFHLVAPVPSLARTPTIAEQALAVTRLQLDQEESADIDVMIAEIKNMTPETLAYMLAEDVHVMGQKEL